MTNARRVTPRIAGATALTFVGGTLFVNGMPASAATFTVTNTDDSGAGSFRQAVIDANAAAGLDSIDFDLPEGSTIALLNQVNITDAVEITGPGETALTLTNASGDVLYVGNAASLYLSALTIAGAGQTAVRMYAAGDLIVKNVTLSSNGQAITSWRQTNGDTYILDATIVDNQSGVEVYGTAGAVSIELTTLSGNEGHAARVTRGGDVSIINSVLDENGTSIAVNYSTSLNVDEVTISKGENRAIESRSTVDVDIANSDIVDTDSSGVSIYGATTVSVGEVTMSGTNGNAMYVRNSTAVKVTDFVSSISDRSGLQIYGTSGETEIRRVTISDAGQDGLRLYRLHGATELSDVTVSKSGSTGIRTRRLYGVTELDRIKVYDSGNHGISTYYSTDLTVRDTVVSGSNSSNIRVGRGASDVVLERVKSSSAGRSPLRVYNASSVSIDDSQFTDSIRDVYVRNVNNLVVRDTTISGSVLRSGAHLYQTNFLIERSTLSDNRSHGIELRYSYGLFRNSTISGNGESGVYARSSDIYLQHSTVTDNSQFGLEGRYIDLYAHHSIIAGNDDGVLDGYNGNERFDYSLLSNGSGFAASGIGNVETDDAMLGPLADNGGKTETHLPLAGSPAVGAGDPAIGGAPTEDQRGDARVVGTIDIGAVEVDRGDVAVSPATTSVDESDGSVAVTVTRSGGTDGPVSVSVVPTNGTAIAPGDFSNAAQVVSWADGESGAKVVDISIVDDSDQEDAENFSVGLSDPSVGVVLVPGVTTVTILANDSLTPELDAAGQFFALPPARVLDTRPAEPAPGPKGKVPGGNTIDVQITGVGGVPTNATAVVMNVTMTESSGPGFVTAWGTGSAQPDTSNLNYTGANQSRPNLVTVPIGDDGKVSLFSSADVHLLADVSGYYVDADSPVADGRLVPLTPTRLFDTRPGEPGDGPKGLVAPDSSIDVQVLGKAGVPSAGVSAVVMNLTATGSVDAGFVTVHPTDQAQPNASVLNMSGPGQTVPNLVIVPVGADGEIRLYTLNSTHLLGDVMGYYTDDTAPSSTSGLFVPLQPDRVFDSRPGEPAPGPKGFLTADSDVDVSVGGVGDIPLDAAAVALNVTATATAAAGFVTGWPTGEPQPDASLLNVAGAGDTRPNATILPLGTDGKISLYTLNGTHLLADSFGYFLG